MRSSKSTGFLLIAIFVTFNLISEINTLGFGENCTVEEDQCDKSRYFQCGYSSATCECSNTLQTWYDEDDDVCKLLVDAACTRGEFDQSCVTNAFCPETQNPTCTCDDGLDQNVERRCFFSHDRECSEADMFPGDPERCDPAAFLKCTAVNNGYFCKCIDMENSFYNPIAQKCHLLVNANCSVSSNPMPCLDNGYCSVHNRTCICDDQTPPTAERRCHLSYGADCDPFKDTCNIPGHTNCHQDLQKCLCTPESEAIYYPSELGCRLLENAGCSVVDGAQRCIKDAECLPAPGGEPRRCKCMYNLSPNKNRECHLTYGNICDQPMDNCDPAGFLKCTNNTCACLNPDSFYDEVARECRYSVGASCRPGQGEQRCGNNSECSLLTETCQCNSLYEDSGDGNCLRSFGAPCSAVDRCNGRNQLHCYVDSCRCNPGFVNSRTGGSDYDITCLPGYGQICPFDEVLQLPCAPEALLNCIGGLCNCVAPGNHIPEEDRCAILVGNQCVPNNTTNVCVTNGFCQTDGFLPGTCACNMGYRETFTGRCTNDGTSFKADNSFVVALLALISFWVKT